jgi:hypothetical protein
MTTDFHREIALSAGFACSARETKKTLRHGVLATLGFVFYDSTQGHKAAEMPGCSARY